MAPASGPIAVQLVRNGVTHDARVLRATQAMVEAGYDARIVGVLASGGQARSTVLAGVPVTRLAPVTLGAFLGRLRLGRAARRAAVIPTASEDSPSKDTDEARSSAATGLRRRAVRFNRLVTTLDFYRLAVRHLAGERPALIHANDHNTMWPALIARARWGSRVVYDSHELWADRNGRREWRPWLLACEWIFVRAADAVISASPGYARALARRNRIVEPRVVRNIPVNASLSVRADDRGHVVAYVGGLMPGRGIEQAIAALPLAPGIELELLGPGSASYTAQLSAAAEQHGVADRVRFVNAVPPEEVVGALRGAGAGLLLIQPICRSYELTLPNKLFEYAAAGLPMIASDLEVIASVVRTQELGLVVGADNLPEIAAAMTRLCDPGERHAFAANAAAYGRLETWAGERLRLIAVYREVLAVDEHGSEELPAAWLQ